jgi:hypothetical protein
MDERRERYAAAAYEDVNPGFRWQDADPRDQESFRLDVAGVMAVADAETASLREELAAWQSRYRSSVETYRDVTAEVARLRSELDAANVMLRKAGNRG